MGRRSIRRGLAALAAVGFMLLVPAAVSAHPLGNFTINHYAGLTIAPDHVDLDVVIDMAEIPTFQERQTMDTDGDGSVGDDEATTWANRRCRDLAHDLRLDLDGAAQTLTLGQVSIAFPGGAGGLSTMRLECPYRVDLAAPLTDRVARISFSDGSYPDRLGWHEIVAVANGTILDTHGLPTTSPSAKLTAYPPSLVATPLDLRSATIDARRDPNPASSESSAPVASAAPAPGGAGPVADAASAPPPAGPGAVPGGVAAELPSIFQTANLTPFVLLGAFLTAIVIGAGHALTPGHGKTLMAAYLVGTRGTAVHAVGLGLSVAVSHTLGIMALAVLIVGAGSFLPPEVVYRVTPVIAGTSIVAIGGWMLINELRRRRRRSAATAVPAHDHGNAPDHDHARAHDREHGDEHEQPHAHEHPVVGAAGDPHPHPHPPEADERPGEHSHGGIRHSHLPPAGATLTWRGLFILGLAGGLIPSTSALLILLSSIAAGRPAFGLVLVIAFGIGMAAVMTGVGLAMIVARTRLDRLPSRSSLGRVAGLVPLVASVAVVGLGLVLSWQAIAGSPVL